MNSAMANFTSLKDSAVLYDLCFQTVTRFAEKASFEIIFVRYENIVSNMKEELTTVLDKIGLDWDDSMLNFYNTALDRGNINTPSYHQVSKPIYKDSVHKWKPYANQLKSIGDIINPWCTRLNYEVL